MREIDDVSTVAPHEVERRLCGLDHIETLAPPFALVDARVLLASWMHKSRSASNEKHDAAA